MCNDDEMLPRVVREECLTTALHTNHFVMIGRCFCARTKTTKANEELGLTDEDGRLSMDRLMAVDATFHDYLLRGHKVARTYAFFAHFVRT
jgi:hypothetical protein